MANNDTGSQTQQQAPTPNPALRRLATLVGAWQIEISLPVDPPIVARGRTTFEWLKEGPFLVGRVSVEHPDFPTGIEIIGGDESTEMYSMLYFDSRGVSRIYQMSLSNEVWKLWRDAPGFSQRFSGTFSDDGNTITASWEKSSDGSNWEHDFDLTYKKVELDEGLKMGKVITELSVSLDGFVAGPNDSPELPLGEGGDRLFQWYNSGDTALPLAGTDMVFKVSRASAEFLREEWGAGGVMVAGRRMFDIAGAWGGRPPGGGPCFIVTHTVPQEWAGEGSPFIFVTDGVESAVRQAKVAAGDGNVSVSSASIMQQAIAAGLVDEIQIDLVPVLLGGGVRLFDHLGATPIQLESTRVVEAPGVTHLRFRVLK